MWVMTVIQTLIKNWRIVAIVGSMLFAALAGYQLRGALCESQIKDIQWNAVLAVQEKEQQQLEKAQDFEKEKSRLKANQNKIQMELNREIKNPIYRDCTIPANSLSIINAAVKNDPTIELGKPL